MKYRKLGACGTKVSAFGLGGWTTFGGSVTDQKVVREIIIDAFESGINFFDIADSYAFGEAEVAMGKVFAELPRHRLVITSKVFNPMSDDVNDRGLSRKHIMESVEKSLKRIGTDYLDLYFCHRFDSETPVEETARAMDDLVHQGKVLYWGTSEWSGENLRELQSICREAGLYRPQVEQPQYSLLARRRFEEDVAPTLSEFGMGSVVWSPLASGLLTGKYDDGIPDESRLSRLKWLADLLVREDLLEKVRRFGSQAEAMGVSRTQLALAWALQHSAVSSVILGASQKSQLKENLRALDIKISNEVNETLAEIFSIDESL